METKEKKVIIVHGDRYEDRINLRVLTTMIKKAIREKRVPSFEIMTTMDAPQQLNGRGDYKIIFLAERDFSEILEMAKKYISNTEIVICSTTTLNGEEFHTNKIGGKFISIPILYPDLVKTL